MRFGAGHNLWYSSNRWWFSIDDLEPDSKPRLKIGWPVGKIWKVSFWRPDISRDWNFAFQRVGYNGCVGVEDDKAMGQSSHVSK